MANKKVENKDIIQQGLFNSTIENAKELLKVLGVLEDQFKDILKTSKAIADSSPLDSYKGIKDTEKAIKNTMRGRRRRSTRRRRSSRRRLGLSLHLRLNDSRCFRIRSHHVHAVSRKPSSIATAKEDTVCRLSDLY